MTAGLLGCPNNDPVECRDQASCDLSPGGVCTVAPSGNQWCAYPDTTCPSGMRYSDQRVGDGLSGVCVADEVDIDAGVDAVDATPIDAPIDAPNIDAPPGVIVVNNQGADIVLGQADFSTAVPNFGGGGAGGIPTDKSLWFPNAVASDGTSLWVTDGGQGRVLRWSPLPMTGYVAATGILGKTSFIDGAATGPSNASNIADTCCGPRVATAGTKLLVSDASRNRVLIWNPLPSTNGQAANMVLGQGTLTATGTSSAANGVSAPNGVWTDGTRVIVADTGNNRVLIWTSFPTASGEAADIVLGQADFGISTLPTSPTASNLKRPRGVHFDGTRLYVADTGHNRVMIWDTLPAANGVPANVVVGQPDFITASLGLAPASSLMLPESVATVSGALIIADTGQDRITFYNPSPTANGASAFAVLGQVAPTVTPVSNPPPSQSSLRDPGGVFVIGSALYVADSGHHRVLRFGLGL